MKTWLSILLSFLITANALAQHKKNVMNEPYEKQFRQADSLLNEGGLPQSAVKVLKSIYSDAKKNNQPVQMLKAQLYLMQAATASEENADTANIAQAVREAKESAFPYSNVWHSIAAQLYFNYYQQHRWQLYQRTAVSDASGQALTEWDAPHFFRVIAKHYNASLNRANELADVSLASFAPVLSGNENTRYLRPSLYDLLAFRALEYYANDEQDVAQPAYRFVIDDPEYLSGVQAFVKKSITAKDSLSRHFKALLVYQDLLAQHRNDERPDALIDADLQRLAFVYNHAAFPFKKKKYLEALRRIEQRYPDIPAAAEASYRIAALEYEADPEKTKEKRDVKAIKASLEAIVKRFPKSEGGIHARQLLNGINQQLLSVQTEEVIVPDEHSKMLVTYKNVPKVYGRVIALTEDTYVALTAAEKEKATSLLTRESKTLKSFSEQLTAAEDYETHTAELAVAPLSTGFYAILLSGNEQFADQDNNLTYVLFQVSDISLITQNSRSSGLVLHRKTGMPLAGAQLDFYRQEWIKGKYAFKKMQSAATDANGTFRITGNNQYFQRIVIGYKGQKMYADGGISTYERGQKETPRPRTFFFTDRSIYRPGQTIYFKGIMLQQEQNGLKSSVLPGKATTVTFYDANGQKVKSLALTTNEWGSVAGSFTAPATGLTGSMRISNDFGDAYISVEEYKRPKFAVTFDPLKGTYALNEQITLTGKALAYAGNVIDGASVKYRVVRATRWPYPWLYRSYRYVPVSGAEMEITNGVTQTDAQGNFSISFQAQPDETADSSLLPQFSYTIYADVTDQSGETRSNTGYVSAGYRSVQIMAAIPETATPQQLDSLRISIANLNGQPVKQQATITIAPLETPSSILRARLWPEPDQRLMDETTFRRLFPLDEYRKESHHEEWKAGAPVYKQSFLSAEQGVLAIPSGTFRNGWYLVTISTKDRSSNAVVEEKKYVQVWDGKGVPYSTLTTYTGKDKYEPGQTAEVAVASGYAQAHLVQVQVDINDKQTITLNAYKGQPVSWSKKLTEGDRGGIGLQWLMVKENRVYTVSETIYVPWSNKELNVSWETHRDKLQPGAKETWTMVVRGHKKEKIAAEMVAGLYDASLDAFRPHGWNIYGLYPSVSNYIDWNKNLGFGIAYNRGLATPEMPVVEGIDKEYETLIWPSTSGYEMRRMYKAGGSMPLEMAAAPAAMADGVAVKRSRSAAKEEANASFTTPPQGSVDQSQPPTNTTADTQPPVRKNLQETAFFYPQLQTDAQGNVRVSFTLPEALTEWRFMALAHTKDMASGQAGGSVKTQKDLMVQPNLPRFLRQGDEMIISAKISNLSEALLKGTATLDIVDAQTMQSLNIPFGFKENTVSFSAEKAQSTTATWRIRVPESRYEPVLLRITARAGNFTDGEENMLPVLTNRMLVTETMPLWMNGAGEKTFRFDKLLNSGNAQTLSQYRLSVEYTGNPAWYAVQALPYLMEYPYECAEQTFNRYYANALAAHILEKAPKVKAIFDSWKDTDTAALMSNLRKNEDLKSALLEETPWVMEAQAEAQQKKNIALLFDSYKLGRSQDAALRKLEEMISSDGSYPWFRGMSEDRYITQYIATGTARLQHLGIKNNRSIALSSRMLNYLTRKISEDYQALLTHKVKLDEQHISYIQAQYLYLRSFRPDYKGDEKSETAFAYYKKQAAKYWTSFNPYLKGMMALSLHRLGDKATAQHIIQSLRETAIRKEEMGMYWMKPGAGYWWYEAPVEAQSLLVECFAEVAGDNNAVNEMKRWLLKQKQTQNWSTTKATADACYALLLQGTQWLENAPAVSIRVGDKVISPDKTEAGTGYFKQAFAGQEVRPEMGNITLNVATASGSKNDAPSWGAVYWQYFENLDKITSAETPLALRKQLFIERNTDRGPVLEEIKDGNSLKVGDKVKVRIVLQSDRDMEYLHLKDMRAACFEPVNVLSGYRWQGGLGYYESTRDASSNFFISYLPKGSYVFEYAVNVMAKGRFSNGISSIQCMYAPEFASHSGGMSVEVK